MIKRFSKKNVLDRIDALEKAAPTEAPFIMFVTTYDDASITVKEHYGVGATGLKTRKYKNIKVVEHQIPCKEASLDYFEKLQKKVNLSDTTIFFEDFNGD